VKNRILFFLPPIFPTLQIQQTTSKTIKVDLGYNPTSLVKLEVYDLNGKKITSTNTNTSYANIQANISNGVYLVKFVFVRQQFMGENPPCNRTWLFA